MHQWFTVFVTHQHPIVVWIFAFVAIDEYEVERQTQRRSDVECRADMQPDFAAVGRTVEIGLRQRLQFVVHFDGVQFGIVSQSGSHRQRRIARERADFQHIVRSVHPYE